MRVDFIRAKEIYAEYFGANRGAYTARRADQGVPRRAITDPGEKSTKSEAGFLRKRRRATAVAAAQAPGAAAHSAEDSENDDDFDEKQQKLLKKQHAAVHQKKVQAYLDGKLLCDEESGDVKTAAAGELSRRHARAGERARKAARVSAVQRTGGADLGPRLKEAVCWVDNGVMSDELSRALRARGCRPTENRADAAIYIVSDPNDPGRRVRWYALLKGAFVVTGRAFTHPDVRGPVVKYLPATSPARTVYITEAFAEKHAEIATILRDTCPAWTFEVDLEAPAPPPAPPVHRCHQHVNCRAWHLPTATPLPPSLQPPGLAGILGEVQRREKTEQEVSNGDPQKAGRSGGGAAQRRGGGHRIVLRKVPLLRQGATKHVYDHGLLHMFLQRLGLKLCRTGMCMGKQ